ncbi:MAG: LysM domain-containing protein [Clostridiales bacterium]|jgi:LysM repeat protein|nr:LysM domain-containing protein [Clostridiales bacterium]
MDQFELPANIKQIGTIGEGMRIYLEDSVCSYLYEFAKAGDYQERVAMLAGRYMVIDSQPILFISGAIEGRHTEVKNGLALFTERSMDYAQECINEHYPGMKIVGWMLSQPSYGASLNSGYAQAHLENFKKKYQVLFVMDPIEKTNAFYTYTRNGASLNESKGYFIYYEKNEGMNKYQELNNPSSRLEAAASEAPPEPRLASERFQAADSLIRVREATRFYQKDMQEQKRVLNLLVGLCAVLFIVTFIMGAGLIQNQDRIASMEKQIVQLNESYINELSQIGKDVSPAYKTDDDATPATQIIEGNESDAPSSQTSATQAEAPSAAPVKYVVKKGDTLNSICVKHYGSAAMLKKVMDYNNIEDPNHIVSGTTIMLPAE